MDVVGRRPAMDVTVIGGGIGGLACAAFLQRQGARVHVYEQASALTPIGAGIVVAPNAVRLLRRLGLMPALQRTAVRVRTGWEFRRWDDGRVLLAQDMSTCEQLYGEAAWLMHRADLVDLLLQAVEPGTVHLGRRCLDVETSADRTAARFADGDRVEADLLVAADGIHSVIRDRMIGTMTARDYGLCAWRAMIPSRDLPERYVAPTQTLWLGPGRHLVHYPVSSGRIVNVVAFAPADPREQAGSWTAEAAPEDFRREFANWNPVVEDLLDVATQVGRWVVRDRPPLPTYGVDRIVLLGDAAHPMVPFFAQGAGQAIEDAAALATLLLEAPDVHTALTAYSAVRLPRTAQVQEVSRQRAVDNHLPDGPEQRARDARLAGEDPLRHSDWLYGYDAQAEARSVLTVST